MTYISREGVKSTAGMALPDGLKAFADAVVHCDISTSRSVCLRGGIRHAHANRFGAPTTVILAWTKRAVRPMMGTAS